MECASERPSWGTAQILRSGDRDRIDFENGVPSAVATDRRLHASLIDLLGLALTHPLGLDAVGMDETGLGPPGVMGREDSLRDHFPSRRFALVARTSLQRLNPQLAPLVVVCQ